MMWHWSTSGGSLRPKELFLADLCLERRALGASWRALAPALRLPGDWPQTLRLRLRLQPAFWSSFAGRRLQLARRLVPSQEGTRGRRLRAPAATHSPPPRRFGAAGTSATPAPEHCGQLAGPHAERVSAHFPVVQHVDHRALCLATQKARREQWPHLATSSFFYAMVPQHWHASAMLLT